MKTLDLGLKDYQEIWALQKDLLAKRADGAIEDTLILVEHPPVYTVGRAGFSPECTPLEGAVQHAPTEIKVRKLGTVPVVEIERGGKLTFHGPGQIVGYPVFALPHHDLRTYLRDLEHVVIQALSDETLLPARPCPESLLLEPGQLQTGVWIGDRKIASIGIAVKRWVSYHGFALNLNTDLRYFEATHPCGFNGSIMTSVKKELGADADMSVLNVNIKRALVKGFENLSNSYAALAESLRKSAFDEGNTEAGTALS